MPKQAPQIDQPCVTCAGKGSVIPQPPADYHSEAYSQWSQESHPAQPCRACKGKGTTQRVNPAWLREVRVEAGLSRKDFSVKTGISYTYITNVENGYAACTPAILAHYAALVAVK